MWLISYQCHSKKTNYCKPQQLTLQDVSITSMMLNPPLVASTTPKNANQALVLVCQRTTIQPSAPCCWSFPRARIWTVQLRLVVPYKWRCLNVLLFIVLGTPSLMFQMNMYKTMWIFIYVGWMNIPLPAANVGVYQGYQDFDTEPLGCLGGWRIGVSSWVLIATCTCWGLGGSTTEKWCHCGRTI